jgi:hypothetical protein
MPSIFLSYRRDDSIDAAGRIYDRLVQHFGRESIFMDVDSIPLGIDFRQYLQDTVSRCDVLLAVIGQGWLEARHSEGPLAGQRRLDNPDDFVRIEIQTALARGIAVIPVLVGRATMPIAKDLPDELKELAFRHAAEVRPGKDFHDHVDRLIRGIESLEQPIDLTVPGELLARRADEPDAEWIKVHRTPKKVLPRPDEVYCLKVADDVGDDELAGLVNLRGLVSLQSLDLGRCGQVKDAGLAHLKDLNSLRFLNLIGCTQVTDASLAHLKGLNSLQSLNLTSCKLVTDAGLAHLKGLNSLQALDLSSCTQVTDAGLAHLKGLNSLQSLNLTSCKLVTDTGLAHLKGLNSLQALDLSSCTQVTDAGLAHLKGLTSQRFLNLAGCKRVTDAGVTELKRVLPECHVVH